MIALLLFFLAGCVGHHAPQTNQTANPYIEQARRLNNAGVVMLGQHHPVRAVKMFSEAIKAATLADSNHWRALSWYNTGRAQAIAGDGIAARQAYRKAMLLAEAEGDRVNAVRARLALARMNSDVKNVPELIAMVQKSYPIDVQLAAGTLAAQYRLNNPAKQAFERVLALAGNDRAGMLYAARAHLGLAGLAWVAGDMVGADSHVKNALALLHRSGAPSLMVQALHLAAALTSDAQKKHRFIQRADDISNALERARSH